MRMTKSLRGKDGTCRAPKRNLVGRSVVAANELVKRRSLKMTIKIHVLVQYAHDIDFINSNFVEHDM